MYVCKHKLYRDIYCVFASVCVCVCRSIQMDRERERETETERGEGGISLCYKASWLNKSDS